MKNTTLIATLMISLFLLSACQSLNFDKAEEQRKQELCKEIDTRELPHCSGSKSG